MGEIQRYRDIKTLINKDPELSSLDNFGITSESEKIIEHFKAKKYEIADGNLMGKRIQEASIIAGINEKSVDWFCYDVPYLFERFLRREYYGRHQDIKATYSQTLADPYLDSNKPYPLVRFYTHLEKYMAFGVKRTKHLASLVEFRSPQDTPLFAAFYNSSGDLTHLRLLLYEGDNAINRPLDKYTHIELFPNEYLDFNFHLGLKSILDLSPINPKIHRGLRKVSSGKPINLENQQQVTTFAFRDSMSLLYASMHSLIFKASIPNHLKQQEVRRALLSGDNNHNWQECIGKLLPYHFTAPSIKVELAN